MQENKKSDETNQNKYEFIDELFFTSPEDDGVTDEDFAPSETGDFEFVIAIDDNEIDDADNSAAEESPIKEKSREQKPKKEKAQKPEKKQSEDKAPKPEKKKVEEKSPMPENNKSEEKAKKAENNKTEEKAQKPEKTKIREKAQKAEKSKTDTHKEPKEQKPVSTAAFIFTVTFKLLLICSIVAALLAWVNSITAPIITQNEIRKKEAALAEIFPELVGYETVQSDYIDIDELYAVSGDSGLLGYCASVSPSGFGGEISLMVGVDSAKNIAGIKVIDHSETAGVGTKALDSKYLSGYIGLGGDRLTLGEDIDAYSGATVSSRAINAGINSALSVYDAVFGADFTAQTAVVEIPLEGTVTIDAALNGADGHGGFYGWISEEHIEEALGVNFSPFEEIYCSKVKAEDGSYIDQGYAALVTVADESGYAKIMVGTYFNTQLGIRFIDYEGESFKKLALDTEYLANYKMNIQNPVPLVYGENIPAHAEADAQARMIAEKAAEVLAFYPEYLERISTDEEVAVNE